MLSEAPLLDVIELEVIIERRFIQISLIMCDVGICEPPDRKILNEN